MVRRSYCPTENRVLCVHTSEVQTKVHRFKIASPAHYWLTIEYKVDYVGTNKKSGNFGGPRKAELEVQAKA